MQTDRKLVQRIKEGDKDAMRLLYVEHKDILLTLANALLHDIALAEDAVHDVFVKFVRNIATFELTGSLKAYLVTCAVNEARTLIRRKRTRAETGSLVAEPQAKESPCPVEAGETAEQLRCHLANLPNEQREVLLLHVKGGLKFREIAQLQQATISTVQARYRYGIEKLRSFMNGEIEK